MQQIKGNKINLFYRTRICVFHETEKCASCVLLKMTHLFIKYYDQKIEFKIENGEQCQS
jgi:hypothetical protein